MYRLSYSGKKSMLNASDTGKVESVRLIKMKSALAVGVRSGNDLIGFKYLEDSVSWKLLWRENIFSCAPDGSSKSYPWWVSDFLGNGDDVIITRHRSGLTFYRATVDELEFQTEDAFFHDLYGWKNAEQISLSGRFYPNTDLMGLMTRDSRQKMQFYVVMKDHIAEKQPQPIWPFSRDLHVTSAFTSKDTDFLLVKWHPTEPETIVLRTSNGLEFHQFDENYELKKIAATSHMAKTTQRDRLFFADLTDHPHQEILHLNAKGLSVYQYDALQMNFNAISHEIGFSESSGWIAKYSDTVKFVDLNRDERDDIIFTGPKGISAMTFDAEMKTWRSLLDVSNLNSAQKYVTVVGVVAADPPSLNHPLVFTQDLNLQLLWGSFVKHSENVKKDKETSATIIPPLKWIDDELQKFQTPSGTLAVVPEQSTRIPLQNKPVLRWTEQWDTSFMQQAVNAASGQVQFKLPLVDVTAAPGVNIQLLASYDSQVTATDLLNAGWSLVMAQDFIVVDKQGSVFHQDFKYFVSQQGRVQQLQVKHFGEEFEFRLPELDDATVLYNVNRQCWTIETAAYTAIYGHCGQSKNKAAVQWSLSWPNWRGSGRDAGHLEPHAIAWYMTQLKSKDADHSLFYSYESDTAAVPGGASYTTSIRLKKISDDKDSSITLEYGLKLSDEYVKPQPIDPDGNINFPTALAPSHYLSEISVTAASFQQKFRFGYKVQDQQRLLMDIDQIIGDHEEKILQFNYKQYGNRFMLSKSFLPLGQTVDYKYEHKIHLLTSKSEVQHPINLPKELPKIAFGSNYTVVAYRGSIFSGAVTVKVFNQAFTNLVEEMSTDSNASKDGQIEMSYQLLAFNDYFIVFLSFTKLQRVCLFYRHEEVWSSSAKRYDFNHDAIVRLSDSMIAVADPKRGGIQILEWLPEQVVWKETFFSVPLIVNMEMHRNFVVGFDGTKLHVIYRDQGGTFTKKVLAEDFSRLNSMSRRVTTRFDISDGLKKQFLNAILQNRLQVERNAIMLHAMGEQYGRLSSHVQLIFLDENYEITQNEYKVIPRDNIYKLEKELESEGSKFLVRYILEDGMYKLRVKKASGKVIEDVEKIKNRNLRADAMEKRLEDLNKHEHLVKFFENSILVNWVKYHVTLTQMGILCGDDTILRIGSRLQLEEFTPKVSINLGNHFVLKASKDDTALFKLYTQENGAVGSEIHELRLNQPDQFINRYPAYLAYQSSPTSVVLLTFADYKTIGPVRVFKNETLLLESTLYNLLTVANVSSTLLVHTNSHELVVRSLLSFMPPKSHARVTLQTLSHGDVSRKTAYEQTQEVDRDNNIYTETIAVIPGADRNISGWYEAIKVFRARDQDATITQKWFDANGAEVQPPIKKKARDSADDTGFDDKITDSKLWDRTGEWLVSNFMPYSLKSDMVAYYGFESYELNQVDALSSETTDARWKFSKTHIVRQGFSFTGESFLHLDGSRGDQFEGEFQPHDQQETYLASCWIRANERLVVDSHVSHLKAVISTKSGTEIVTLLAQVKRNFGVWSYVELLLDFSLLKKIYEAYHTKNRQHYLPLPTLVELKIKLKIAPKRGSIVDLDHIRFTPIAHNFEAKIYESTGLVTALIRSDGLVTRTLFNHKHQEIVKIREDGSLETFSMGTKSGGLIPALTGALTNQLPCTIKIESESGFYENFDEVAWHRRWRLDDRSAWMTAPGQLMHKSPKKHRIESVPVLVDTVSGAFYCFYSLVDLQSSLHWVGPSYRLTLARQKGVLATLTLKTRKESFVNSIPSSGELVAMIEHSRFLVWIDGVLTLDQDLSSLWMSEKISTTFSIEAQGEVLIENFLIMNRPQLEVQYSNAWGETTQTIHLIDVTTVHLNEKLYDILGRPAIITQTTEIKRTTNQPLLAYNRNFVANVNPSNQSSVWYTGRLQGDVNLMNPKDRGFAYTRVGFDRTPFNEKQVIGLPSPEFSIAGSLATRLSNSSGVAFLENLFPTKQGFRQQVENQPNGSQLVNVFDKRNKRVAEYVRVPGFDHHLSTYEYDDSLRLVKILPPMYHEKVGSSSQTKPWQPGSSHLTDQERHWQKVLGTHLEYNSKDQLVRKITPDDGIVEIMYTSFGKKRFMVSLGSDGQSDQVTYFNYDRIGQLIETGFLEKSFSRTDLQKYLEVRDLPQPQTFQKFFNSDSHEDPNLRGRLKRFLTYNEGDPVVEELYYNEQERVSKKRTMAIPGITSDEAFTDIEKYYKAGRLHTLVYPGFGDNQPLYVVHSYNKRGQLNALGTPDNPTRFAKFSYHTNGHLATEQYQPTTGNFTRDYSYSSPGFLEKIADKFITERLHYTDKGFGQGGFGDGIVMRTTFEASWTEEADVRSFQLKDTELDDIRYSTLCVRALKRTGHLSSNGTPQKLLLQSSEISLPILCSGEFGNRLAQILAVKQPPKFYGHAYAYGNHKELLKAKYFSGHTENDQQPLQRDTFSKEILKVSSLQSHQIWTLLTQAEFVVSDQNTNDPAPAVGHRGRSVFRDKELEDELTKLNTPRKDFSIFLQSISKKSLEAYGQRRKVAFSEFKQFFLHWEGLDEGSASARDQENASRLYSVLSSNEFLPTESKPLVLNTKFTALMGSYRDVLPDIVRVLHQHFANDLGETAFDVNSYEIDANGNHKNFYTGFHRYKLEYESDTNKVKSVKVNNLTASDSEESFEVEHDAHGNVIKALHKNISNIAYHPTSGHTTAIELTDGRKLRFHYDAQGERVLKQVFNAEGEIVQETLYLRDEEGRVLMDRRSSFSSGGVTTETTVTSYLYGPRGLLGFFRNNEFFSVTTDHAGSVRLVAKNGQVVAAYDYMPYGQLMRTYGNDPLGHIMYRFTGQEWDEETGLYNFHARLYDPIIGRFFQTDPKAQYFSPYKYAGNSPVSMVDPDGEEAFLIAIGVCALFGLFFGGAAANNRWNPADWDFSDTGTWTGMIGGTLAGALLPVAIGPAVASLGVAGTIAAGTAGAYLTMAGSNNDWDLSKWEWDRPHTWNAAFQGFGAGISVVDAFKDAHKLAGQITIFGKASKPLFLTLTYGLAAGVMYGAAVTFNNGTAAPWHWKWEQAGTYSALFDGFNMGFTLPQVALKSFAKVEDAAKTVAKLSEKMSDTFEKVSKFVDLATFAKNLSRASLAAFVAYHIGQTAYANFNLDWDNSFSTYQGVLNGIFSCKDVTYMLELYTTEREPIVESVNMKQETQGWSNAANEVLRTLFYKSYQNFIRQSLKSTKLEDVMDLKLAFETWNSEKGSPKELLDLIQKSSTFGPVDVFNKMFELKNQAELQEEKTKTVIVENKVDFLLCSGGKRRKRETSSISYCRVPAQLQSHMSPAKVRMARSDDLHKLVGMSVEDSAFKKVATQISDRRKTSRDAGLVLDDADTPESMKRRATDHSNKSRELIECDTLNPDAPAQMAVLPSCSDVRHFNESLKSAEEFMDSAMTSGGSRLRFWPGQVIKNVGSVVIDAASSLFRQRTSPSKTLRLESVPLSGSFESGAPSCDASLLEIGDQWLSSTQMNGNLMWATLLAKKITGRSFKDHPVRPNVSKVEVTIMALEIIESFEETLMQHAVESGIEAEATQILENTDLALIARKLSHKMQNDDWDGISDLLYGKMVTDIIVALLTIFQLSTDQTEIFSLAVTNSKLKIMKFVTHKINKKFYTQN